MKAKTSWMAIVPDLLMFCIMIGMITIWSKLIKILTTKLEIDDKFLRFTFYEVMVKNKVSNQQEDEFLNLAKNKLNNILK